MTEFSTIILNAANEFKKATENYAKIVEQEQRNKEQREKSAKVHFERELPSNANSSKEPIKIATESIAHQKLSLKESKSHEENHKLEEKSIVISIKKPTEGSAKPESHKVSKQPEGSTISRKIQESATREESKA
jgi:hypothetical protein